MSKPERLGRKDWLYIVGGTIAVLALIPLIAFFGAAMQIGFVLVMPSILIGSTIMAFTSKTELVMSQVQGIDVPNRTFLHPHHAWARRASKTCVVAGIDDFAQRLIGPVESVETAAVGTRVKAGDVVATVHHGERDLPVVAPVDGTIAGINPQLAKEPQVVNRAPYGRGWLVEITPENEKHAFDALVSERHALKWMRKEVDRLVALTTPPELGHTLADGGHVHGDVSKQLDDETWRKVQAAFF